MFPGRQIARRIVQIRHVARHHPRRFDREAKYRGISVEQLLAAAIAEMVRERLQGARHGRTS
jgi:hypothetical protein